MSHAVFDVVTRSMNRRFSTGSLGHLAPHWSAYLFSVVTLLSSVTFLSLYSITITQNCLLYVQPAAQTEETDDDAVKPKAEVKQTVSLTSNLNLRTLRPLKCVVAPEIIYAYY